MHLFSVFLGNICLCVDTYRYKRLLLRLAAKHPFMGTKKMAEILHAQALQPFFNMPHGHVIQVCNHMIRTFFLKILLYLSGAIQTQQMDSRQSLEQNGHG